MQKIILASLVTLMAHPMVAMQPYFSLTDAAAAGDIAQVQHLLDAGASVNHADRWGETALMFAVDRGHEQILRLLIRAGASVNHVSKFETSALMRAANIQREHIVRLLLGAGASVNQINKNNDTALIVAACYGNEPICTLLIERMLKIPNDAQRKRIYLALFCIKKRFGRDIYSLFKAPMLCTLIEEENRENFKNSVAKREIDKIGNDNIKQRLLATYSQDNTSQANKRRRITHDL